MDLIKGEYVLDLTFYEIGNALRKLHLDGKLTLEDAKSLMNVMTSLMDRIIIVIRVSELNLSEVLRKAVESRITFYDASYVIAARSRELILVTDDVKLAQAASKEVRVADSSGLFQV